MLTRCERVGRGHAAVSLWVAMGVALSLLPAPAPAAYAHAQQSRTMNGIAVSGRFLEVWSRQGSDANSVYVNGLPITQRRSEISLEDGRTYETQWFERARYELHSENSPPNDVLLGRLGAWDSEGRGKVDPATGKAANPDGAPFVPLLKPQDADGTRKLWFPETGHTLSGKLLDYWWRYGGLAQFGYPLSEPFEEISRADGKPYTVQYFERARMELHPEKPAPYEVELGLLGVEQYLLTPIPAENLPFAPTAGVRTSKENITIGSSQEPADLTIFSNASINTRLRSLIEDGLVARDDNDNLFPANAWYVPTLENGGARFVGVGDDRHLRVKYKIRPGIKWSDGAELTSRDAVFAYKLIMDPNAPVVSRQEQQRLQNVDNPDKYTVIYNYRSAKQVREYYNSIPDNKYYKEYYDFLLYFVETSKPVVSQNYAAIGIIQPEHVLSRIPPSQMKESTFARAPIGTGPWKVESWTTAREITFVPNEHYSLTTKPAIKRITVRFITDVNQLLTGARNGALDVIGSEAFAVPPSTEGFTAAGLELRGRPGSIMEMLFFNFEFGPFKEKAVREAIFTAINRQRIVDQVLGGTSRVPNSVTPSTLYYSLEYPGFAGLYPEIASQHQLPNYPYDPVRAARLLEDAGWKLGPDGVRVKNGVKLQFDYATYINAVRQRVQELVTIDLRMIGVDAVRKSYPSAIFCDFPPCSLWAGGQTKIAQYVPNPLNFDEWTCKELYDPRTNAGLNEQKYCNPALDRANLEFQNEALLRPQLTFAAEAQVILMQDLAIVPLYQRPIIEVVSTRLVNHKLPGIHSSNSSFWNARQWYFK
jgi:peptide/nickel transport system substrate-binding protein